MLALAALLVVAAPEPTTEAGKLLQIAWNSQYEWKEDDVSNATLEFTWSYTYRSRDGVDSGRSGRAQVVLVDGAVARRHYPGLADDDMRRRLDEHVDWIVARFIRRPFSEAFKEEDLKGPEDAAGGSRKISSGRRGLILKDDRLFAEEIDIGAEGRPFVVRVDYTLADVRGGYTITGASCSYTFETARTSWKRELKLKEGAVPPAPVSYVHGEDRPDGREELRLDFAAATFNAAHPVVLDPAARDALKAVWEKRYVLPADVRIEGEYVRKVDNDLARAGWTNGVKGEFQVWGMDKILVAVDERWQGRWGDEILRTSTDHFKEYFARLAPTPFDTEFAGVGFRLEEAGKERIVHLVGYPRAMAFRLDNAGITGHMERVGAEEGWWDWKVKDTREGWVVDRMTRKFESGKVDLKYRFSTKKGIPVPTDFDMLGVPRWNRGDETIVGAVSYELKRLKVSLPDG